MFGFGGYDYHDRHATTRYYHGLDSAERLATLVLLNMSVVSDTSTGLLGFEFILLSAQPSSQLRQLTMILAVLALPLRNELGPGSSVGDFPTA